MSTDEQDATLTVLLRVTPEDAQRILRALDELSVSMAVAPSGWRSATNYRRLSADVRRQANRAYVPPRAVLAPSGQAA